jgi:hypothetical protein
MHLSLLLPMALGVTPYLRLNLAPEVESAVERVLVLGDKPILSRPIPAAVVWTRTTDALSLLRVTHESAVESAGTGGIAGCSSIGHLFVPSGREEIGGTPYPPDL